MSQRLNLAAVQMDVQLGAVEGNLAAICSRLEQAARQKAQLVVFPECALTGYCISSRDEAAQLAQTIPGPATDHLANVCRQLGTQVVLGMLERDGDQLFNACALVGPEGVLDSYRKIHLPYLGVDRLVTPGDRPFAVRQSGPVRIGMNICYDGAFPESARVMALAGADLIVLPTNWPPGAESFASYVINARAMENCVYYCAANRIGTERGFRFIGGSKICDTDGQTLAEASSDEEQILFAEIDLERARNKHLVRVPDKHEINRFADRRPDMYHAIVEPVDQALARKR